MLQVHMLLQQTIEHKLPHVYKMQTMCNINFIFDSQGSQNTLVSVFRFISIDTVDEYRNKL